MQIRRRPVVAAGALLMAVYSFLLFPLLHTGNGLVLALALVLGQAVIQPMMYGPLAARYAELFSTHSRYTGASLGYQLSALGAGLAPVIFAQVQAATGGEGTGVISLTIAGFCLLTVVCILVLRETNRKNLAEPADPATVTPAVP